MKIFSSLFLVLIIALVLVGCKKEEDAEPDNLPVGKDWIITQIELKDNNGSVTPVASTAACDADDIYRFRTDNTYVHEEGATKCDAGDPQIVDQGTWAKVEKKFTWDGQEFLIETLNRQTFKIKTEAFGSTFTIVFTAQ